VEIVYLGLLEIPRGLMDVIHAAAQLSKRYPGQFRFRIIGDGRDAELLRAEANKLQLDEPHITFTGRLPYTDALQLVAQADVGIIPHHANESWNTTIPNKLFDYMAAGLPVLSSDAAPCVRVLQETGAGRVFRSGDAGHLATVATTFLDPEVRHALGEAGRNATQVRYNWEHDTETLLTLVAEATTQ